MHAALLPPDEAFRASLELTLAEHRQWLYNADPDLFAIVSPRRVPDSRVPCPRAVGGIRSVPSAGPAHRHPRKQTWRFTLGMLHPCSMRLNVRARDRDTAIRKAFAKARRERTRRQQDSPGTQPFVAILHAPGNTRPSPAPAQRLRGRRPACRHRAARGPRQHAFTRTHE